MACLLIHWRRKSVGITGLNNYMCKKENFCFIYLLNYTYITFDLIQLGLIWLSLADFDTAVHPKLEGEQLLAQE